jgi:thiol-disulfide isomerase/thioredoxin
MSSLFVVAIEVIDMQHRNKLEIIYSTFILMLMMVAVPPVFAEDQHLDWNDKAIKWHSYDEGVSLAQETGKPILLMFYADWCTTCHSLKAVFENQEVMDHIEQVIAVRVNVDEHPELNAKYNLDGIYIPRTLLLESSGDVITKVYEQGRQFKYFLTANEADRLVVMLKNIQAN